MTSFPYLDIDRPFGIAHRGGDEVAPENTIEAFDHAVGQGFDHLETDVRLSADGVLVACHDASLGRVSGHAGAIGDLTWDQLSAIDLGAGARLATMEDLLGRYDSHRWNIDPKADDTVEPLAELLTRTNAVQRVCVGSFSDRRIRRLRAQLGPALCTSPGPRQLTVFWLAVRAGRASSWFRSNPAMRTLAEQHGCLQIPETVKGIPVVETHLVEAAHALGLQVHVWTINDRSSMDRLIDRGVDAVISDKLTVLREALQDRHGVDG